MRIVRGTNPALPFSVVGPRGALLGQQDGSFEGWVFPWKVLSHMRLTVNMQGYPVPIDVNQQASSIAVEPDHTIITFSHANFTLREVLFAPHEAAAGGGALGYFEVEAIRPLDLTFSFTPEMKLFWPGTSDVSPSPEWVPTAGGSGFYILHLADPAQAAALAIPGAEPGILAPYQERPRTYPLQCVLHVDPKRDRGRVFPLLLTVGDTAGAAQAASLHAALMEQDRTFSATAMANRAYYEHFLAQHTSIETPDPKLNEAFRWAELSIDQLQVEVLPGHTETALTAGFFTSGDSARPGFGWFFGRDALWTLYAVNGYGDFPLARDEFEFLLKRQRTDGKILHEWSQAAYLIDWLKTPYAYASADSTPLLLMAMADYVAISGDTAFAAQHWDQLSKAWQFESSHDSDGDGIYENTEGTGWVESWPPGMPHQEIYLAAVDAQASTAFSRLARATGHSAEADGAERRAAHIRQAIEREYYLPKDRFYAFSRNADGSTDASATIFPAVAWWDGTLSLAEAGPMLSRWAASEFSTDWGTRDLSPQSSFYDPISYHQGTVWPLYTGWVSMAEYRAGRSLSAYAHLRQNAEMIWSEDLGNVTELLSGEFFHPLGRSTSHQLWSAAMVITPTLRGLFGIGWDAPHHTLTLSPHLPASWDRATVRRVPVGNGTTDLEFTRRGADLLVHASNGVTLRSEVAGAEAHGSDLRLPLPAVEAELDQHLPEPGATTTQTKVLDQQTDAHSLALRLEGMAGTTQRIRLRVNAPGIRPTVDGSALREGSPLATAEVSFPAGAPGYVEKTVVVRW